MTPRDFLEKWHGIHLQNYHVGDADAEIASYFYDDIADGAIDEILVVMKEYAKLMCQSQKNICAEEAETKDISNGLSYERYDAVDRDSILNSPFPRELQ